MAKKVKEKKKSAYYFLNKWLYDGSKTTSIPQELIDDKSIGQQILLYYYKDSIYNLYISKWFNNFGIYSLDRLEVFKFLKDTILRCGYRPKYQTRINNIKTNFFKLLKNKFPCLKEAEIELLIKNIDSSDEKDFIYESFGLLNKSKKKKVTKAQLKEFTKLIETEQTESSYSLNNYLKGFTIV